MKVTVSGAGIQRKKDLIEAANFFGELLLGPKLAKNIHIKIKIKNKLDVLGECGPISVGRNPRNFEINLCKRNKDIISTLAHEMVHVKQFARNELGQLWEIKTPRGVLCKARWKGKNWTPSRREDNYYDAPWEVEAHGREIGLHCRWIDYKST